MTLWVWMWEKVSAGRAYHVDVFVYEAHQQRIKYDAQKTMKVMFYKNNTKTMETSAYDDAYDLSGSGCSPTDKFAIVLHGWIQSCSDEWALSLIESEHFLHFFQCQS